jgi:hypothetical protein
MLTKSDMAAIQVESIAVLPNFRIVQGWTKGSRLSRNLRLAIALVQVWRTMLSFTAC